MIAFKEASYLIGARATNAQEAARYAAIAARSKRTIQLDLAAGVDIVAVREALANVDVPVILAGSIAQAAGVDLVLTPPDPDQIASVVQMRKPFACLLGASRPLAESIEKLDGDPEFRPWHYVIACARPSEASQALGALFRTAPSLAHRVTGVCADASALDVEVFEHEMRECVKTFGLQLADVTGASPLDPYVTALARI